MTAKIDGTNGVLQQYDYQVSTTGFSYTFAAGTNVLVMNPAGTLATGTITMPASPADGMTITFSSTQTITALTVNANTGQSIVSAATVLPARQATTYVYRLSNTTWYPMSTVATNVPVAPAGGSIITSGTAVATTSGTSITFSSLPSWVKRITVMFQGVSSSGTSPILIQLGAGSATTSGYTAGAGYYLNGPATGAVAATTGFNIRSAPGASDIHYGLMTICSLGSNAWVESWVGWMSNNTTCETGAGTVTLSGTLDRVILTTAGGTDTFDAGSINILYE